MAAHVQITPNLAETYRCDELLLSIFSGPLKVQVILQFSDNLSFLICNFPISFIYLNV